MKKIVLSIVLSLLLLSGTVFAVPITDFEKGKSAIDIGMTRPELTVEPVDFGEKTNFDFGITTGLNDKIALQYKYQKLDTATLPLPFNSKIHEFNVLYKLTPDAYAFVGAQRLSGVIPLASSAMDAKTVAQIGITGVAQLSDKLDGWATAAVGNDNHSYEVGVGYALSNQADLNLFYRYKKFNDLEYPSVWGKLDGKFRGMGASISVKF